MDLTVYDIIKGPRITEKAYQLNKQASKLVLDIHPHANKSMVAEALFKIFDVKVDKIAIIVVKGKQRRSGRYSIVGKTRKKAIVTLKKGHSIDIMGLSDTPFANEHSE